MASKDKGPKATKSAQTEASRGPVGHWNDLPAPPELSDALNAVAVVIRKLRGVETDTVKAIYAGTVVLSFGAAQIPHDEHNPVFAARAVPATDEAAARELEGALAVADTRTVTVGEEATLLPWGTIISIILPLLLKWFQNR
jgi:hypothetical protein